MMSTNKWLKQAAVAGALCGCGLLSADDARAGDSTVPSAWNVAPMTNGAYREAFETNLPAWAGRIGACALSNLTYSAAGLPTRSNEWFETHQKVLLLDTEGSVVTNTLAYPGAEGAVSFASKPVYVDMRVRFDAIADAPSAETLADSKLAVFVSSDSKLVVIHADGWTTNAVAVDTNEWHQLTVKMLNGKFDVLLDDETVVSNLTLMNVGANTLSAASFCGTGLIDDLYVSHGNPAYLVPGPTAAIPELPAAGSNPPTDEQQTRINAWLNSYPAVTTLSLTQDELSNAYLLNDLNVADGTNGVAGSYTFGLSKIDMVSPTDLNLTAALEVNDEPKSGAINGRIQISGKTHIGGVWQLLDGAITPLFANFVNGEATYNYHIPSPQAGTIIYEEDFEGIETDNSVDSMNAIGWDIIETAPAPLNLAHSAKYTISGGKLTTDNLTATVGTSNDSYVLIKPSEYMKQYCTNDYTYQYDVTYRDAENATRYVSLLCNYTGSNVYNTVDLRYAGNGYNQFRYKIPTEWNHYNTDDYTWPIQTTGTVSMLNQLFGQPYTSSVTNGFKDKLCTVRVEMSMANGPSVYVNGLLVSQMNRYQTYWDQTKNFSYAICFKTSNKVKAEIDNIKVWTGCGVEPGGYRFFRPMIVP